MTSGGNGPTIAIQVVAPQLLVSGRGFLPGGQITVRVENPDGTVTYFQYAADASGEVAAALPTPIPHGTVHISATDSRPDLGDETGMRWTDTDTVSW